MTSLSDEEKQTYKDLVKQKTKDEGFRLEDSSFKHCWKFIQKRKDDPEEEIENKETKEILIVENNTNEVKVESQLEFKLEHNQQQDEDIKTEVVDKNVENKNDDKYEPHQYSEDMYYIKSS